MAPLELPALGAAFWVLRDTRPGYRYEMEQPAFGGVLFQSSPVPACIGPALRGPTSTGSRCGAGAGVLGSPSAAACPALAAELSAKTPNLLLCRTLQTSVFLNKRASAEKCQKQCKATSVRMPVLKYFF